MAHPLAGKPAPREVLVDVEKLLRLYFDEKPDPSDPQQRVAFGTSGHRGSSLRRAINEGHIIAPYVRDLGNVIDLEAARGLHLGADPLGGANLDYWDPIAAEYGLDITVVNRTIDPTFGFMTLDHDGKIRMDCSSPYAMAKLVGLKNEFRVAFANDPDSDRHGIVTPSAGLMNPNHYLAVAIGYLLTHRPQWPSDTA